MNGTLRSLALASGFALSLSTAACDSDNPGPTADVLAEDSTLALQVMSARADTLLAPPDSERIVADVSPTRPITIEPLADSEASVAPTRTVAVAPAFAPAVVTPRRPAPVVRERAPAPIAVPRTTVETQPVKVASVETRPVKVVSSEPKPARRTTRTLGIVSAGSSLSLVAGQRICTYAANEGDTFNAIVLEPVRGTNDVVIPKGALAVAEIASVGKWGAGIGVKVRSVRFEGRTYQVNSDVGYVAVEASKSKGSVCIPERGRIDAELTRPLAVLASN